MKHDHKADRPNKKRRRHKRRQRQAPKSMVTEIRHLLPIETVRGLRNLAKKRKHRK